MKFKTLNCLLSLGLVLSVLLGLFSAVTVSAEKASVEIVTAAAEDSTLADRAQAIAAEINLLPATGGNLNGRIDLSGFSQSSDGTKDMKDLKGKYYIIRPDSKNYVLDGSWTGTNGNLSMTGVTTSGYSVVSGVNPSMAFELHYRGLSGGKPLYVLRFNNGRNVAVGTQYSDWTELYYVKADTTSDLTKAPTVLFEHPNGKSWIRISNGAGTHGWRQDANLSCFRWKDNSKGDNDYAGNAVELYRLWSTEALGKQIQNMKNYLQYPELYDETVYGEFLTCLADSVVLFKKYNSNPTSLIAPYDYIQDTLDKQTSSLKTYTSKLIISDDLNVEQTTILLRQEVDSLPTTGALRNGKVDLSSFSQSADGSKEMKNLRGKHFIVRHDSKSYALCANWTGSNGDLPLQEVTTSGYAITSSISPALAFDFHYRGLASNGKPLYVLRFNNGRNLAVGSQYSGWPELYYVKADTTSNVSQAPTVILDHPNGQSWIRISNGTGTHGLRQNSGPSVFRWKDGSAGDDYSGNAVELYRQWSSREIIAAIHDMRGYLDTPEFFDEAVYKQFLTCMREAIDLFWKYNGWPTALVDPYNFIQETLDAKEEELRSFASRLSFAVTDPPAAELSTTTKIHQLPLDCCYIIQTRGGKILVVDGGYQEANSDGKYLFSYLQKITGKTKPHIDGWFITHAHGDHHGCVPTFAELYRDQCTIDAFYYHYPSYEEIQKYLSGCGVDDTWGAVDWIPTWLIPKFKNKEGGPTKGIQCNTRHSGKCNYAFDFDEVHIEILLTFDDIMWAVDNVSGRYSGTSANEGRVFSNKTFKELINDNFNETSMVFRASAGGKSFMITGDINYVGGYMLNKFHDANAKDSSQYYSLKTDYIQVSHHGHYGLPKNTYNRIDPDVALWPVGSADYNTTTYQNLICTRQWFSDMGTASYPAYAGPHVFEIPVVRTDGAVKIPAELKDFLFDAEYYSNKYADLKALYGTDENQLYYHFLNYGIEEGRSASPFFDVKYYANHNGAALRDTAKGNYIAVFNDFLNNYRSNSLKKLSEIFDASVYAANHKELASQGYTTNFALLHHYVENGYAEGEIATKSFLCSDRSMTYHDNCTVTQAVAPTCTTPGQITSVKCNTCGLVLAEGKTLPATGHTEVTEDAVAPTCTAEGKTEGKYCSVCKEVLLAQEVIPATGHAEVTQEAVAPTCTTEGKTEGKYCSVCEEILLVQETVPATGHTEVTASALDPTCTTAGMTEGTYCTECGTVLLAQEVIPPTGHKEVVDPGLMPSCRESGWTEGKHCSVCGTVTLAQEIIPATGHSYRYSKLDDQRHRLTCANCGSSKTEAHSYENSLCICGAREAVQPVLDSALKLNHSLNLASDISLNFIVPKATLAGYDMSTVYVECDLEVYEDEFLTGKTQVRIDAEEVGNYYYFTLTGLTAVQMNDTVSSVLYGEKDGQLYCSAVDSYSICDYAYSQLNKAGSSVALKTLCADLLRYGAKAQVFKGYRTLELADGRMTEAHKAYLSDIEAVTFGNTNKVLNDLPGATVTWAGKALDLDSKVCLKFIFDPTGYTGDVADLTLKVSYKDLYGEAMSLTLTESAVYDPGRNLYAFTLDALLASELREVVSVQIYAGNTPVSATLQYSADTYGNNKTGNLLELCKALVAYSDSAKSFFVAS